MLKLIHQGHMGAEKCLLKAKESLLWPGIKRNIKELTTKCPTCMQFSKQQPKEELQPHSVPSFPWQKLGCDLFGYHGAQYLFNHLKSIFAEHGIPESLVTDNGHQYCSKDFAAFCNQWRINHITSSPLYPKSNGFIERMVQTVKNLLKKSETH